MEAPRPRVEMETLKVFVGRAPELAELEAGLTAAIEGRGRPFVISGEPGIGKTRLADELADRAASRGVRVLWGRCWEGGGAPAYWPWIQVIRTLFGGGGRQRPDAISPEIADLVPELSRPSARDAGQGQETTDPEQARFRLFDAVARALKQSVRLEPMLVVLEDLHGADQDSLQMLKFAARELKDAPVMVVGTYRDLEVRRSPALMALIADIAREGRVLALGGLSDREVAQLVEGRTGVAPSSTLVAELHQATAGNPLFVDGVVRLLAAEGRSDAASGAGFKIPDDVREAIRRWLSTLSDSVRTVLTTAALMGNEFELRLLECVSDASPGELLDSIAEACEAGIAIKGGGSRYRFSHGLFRQVLDDGLASATRMRLHQRIGVELEKRCGPDPAVHLAALAHHFGEAAPLGEFAKAIDYSIRAGEAAYSVHAYGEATVHWEAASRLMPERGDARRPRLLGRLALALAYTRASDEALRLASQAGAMIATSEGQDPAADYMADAAFAMSGSGSVRGSWALAAQGLGYIGDRRDAVWARLAGFDVMREEAEDPDNPGTMLDSPRRRELAGVIEKILAERRQKSPIDLEAFFTPLEVFLGQLRIFPSREDLLGRASNDPVLLLLWAGEFRRALPLLQQHALRAAELGAMANAVRAFGQLSRCQTALGDFPAAWASYAEAGRYAARLTGPSAAMTIRAGARTELCLALDEGWERLVRGPDPVAERAPEDKWVMAAVCAARAQIFAHLDRPTEALALVAQAIPAIERAPGWAANYIFTACNAASALWRLGRQDHLATLDRNIREKVVAPDFRHPMIDGRLSLARLCVLQERYDEAIEWFARARSVLEEQEARPLLAIAEFDQAITFSRRGGLRDREEAGQHLHAAIEEFQALGMTGWLRRAEGALRRWGTSPSPAARDKGTTSAGSTNTFRLEGDYWTIRYEGQELRIKDAKGLRDLAVLLANPGKEIHVTDLIAASGNPERDPRAGAYERMGPEQLAAIGLEVSSGGRSETALDAPARSAYRVRLAELKDDLAEAERCNDTGRATKARAELEFIAAELASAYGLGGRSRTPGADPLERARKAIGFRIRESVSRIHRAHRVLGLHLRTSVKTGTFCSYAPQAPTPWDVAVQPRPSNR